MPDIKTISLIIPVYNEEASIAPFIRALHTLELPNYLLELVFIDDGSDDATWEALLAQKNEAQGNDFTYKLVKLSRNFGKESALTAGLEIASGDAVIPIDVDLQDPIEVIPKMVKQWEGGYEVVLAKRTNRETDGFAKRFYANSFYKVFSKITEINMPDNVGDFRLMSRKVVNELLKLPENQRFMKGLFSWVGFRAATVEYTRIERAAGITKFSFWKLWNFALEGITSFSSFPLRSFLYLGATISAFSFIYILVLIIKTLVLGVDVPGYASLITLVLFFGGFNILAIGVLGEYIGRIYNESKRRPIYIVDKIE